MRKFIYLIGSTDDFESIEDLKAAYFNGDTDRNMSYFPIEISEACKVTGYLTLQELAVMIGRGEAMTDSWCLDDTVSTLLEA